MPKAEAAKEGPKRVDRRRTDTRQRIQQVALELFAEQGYEKTSLREIAERLGVTRPALYYHFKAKEDILAGVVGDLTAALDELLEWGAAQPRTVDARRELVRRLAALVGGQWRALIRFAQTNQMSMQHNEVGQGFAERMQTLMRLFDDADAELIDKARRRLAVVALLVTSAMPEDNLGASDEERAAVALQIALELVS